MFKERGDCLSHLLTLSTNRFIIIAIIIVVQGPTKDVIGLGESEPPSSILVLFDSLVCPLFDFMSQE